ncbi:MAG: LOG family protein, partial [Yaniella sp.]|nr:LOG family protein [Yaniella sp.]MDN6173084.1 LOG family protein [Yaniella sp.]
GLHTKPVALYNVDGFWDPLINMLDHMQAQGFIRSAFREALIVADDTPSLLAAIDDWYRQPSSST